MFLINKLHSLIFTPVYNNMYPLSKTDNICEKFNKNDFTEEEQKYIDKIHSYLVMELHDNVMSEQENKRNLSRLYKTKKRKIEDKDGNKRKEKMQELKRGREDEEKKYTYNIEERDKKADLINKVLYDIEQGNVDDEDIEIMDIIIASHKLSNGYQIFIFILIFCIVAYFLFKNII